MDTKTAAIYMLFGWVMLCMFCIVQLRADLDKALEIKAPLVVVQKEVLDLQADNLILRHRLSRLEYGEKKIELSIYFKHMERIARTKKSTKAETYIGGQGR